MSLGRSEWERNRTEQQYCRSDHKNRKNECWCFRREEKSNQTDHTRFEAPPEMKRVADRVRHACPPLLDSSASLLTQYPTRHGFRLRLRIFRHTGWLSSCWPPESRPKFRLFIVFQDLCSWSIHPPSSARLPPWTNIFSTLERETLQIVRTLIFYTISSYNPIDSFKDLCVEDMAFQTTTSDRSTSPMLPLDSLGMIAENYRTEYEMCRHSTNRILSATGQQDLVR
jgi:hypothetical protein